MNLSTDIFIRAQIVYCSVALSTVLSTAGAQNRAQEHNEAKFKIISEKIHNGGNKFSKIIHYFICETG